MNAYKQFSALNVTDYTYVPVCIHSKHYFITSDGAGLLTGLDNWLKKDVCPFMFWIQKKKTLINKGFLKALSCANMQDLHTCKHTFVTLFTLVNKQTLRWQKKTKKQFNMFTIIVQIKTHKSSMNIHWSIAGCGIKWGNLPHQNLILNSILQASQLNLNSS